MPKIIKTTWNSSQQEKKLRKEFYNLFKHSPIPKEEFLRNIYLYLKRQDLSSLLFFNDMYKEIINIHGSIFEFGVRWGRNLALLSSLRGVYEPFNHTRNIVGFDTFEGLQSLDSRDGNHDIVKKGSLSVSSKYENYLNKVLQYHEEEAPISHIKKYELIKGDVNKTLDKYLKENPQTIIAMAYFDMDIYKPTKLCLKKIKNRLGKGSIIGFDELASKKFPGETIALFETLGVENYSIQRSPYSAFQSYIRIE